jgi:hypothetical protein
MAIRDCTKICLVIDGVAMQTTAKLLRHGSLSTVLWHAWQQFEVEHAEAGIIGKVAGYHCEFLNRTVQIQIDVY